MKTKRTGMSIDLGVPTILIIFVCLGMCILSLLTYLEANQNAKSTQTEIQTVSNYYKADAKGQYLLECLDQGKELPYPLKEGKISFPISKSQELYIKVKDQKVVTYRVRERNDN